MQFSVHAVHLVCIRLYMPPEAQRLMDTLKVLPTANSLKKLGNSCNLVLEWPWTIQAQHDPRSKMRKLGGCGKVRKYLSKNRRLERGHLTRSRSTTEPLANDQDWVPTLKHS